MRTVRSVFLALLVLVVFAPCGAGREDVAAQTQPYVVSPLPPGGPAPHLPDGHPDLSGHWFPNGAGQGVSGRYGVDPLAIRQFDAFNSDNAGAIA